MNGCLPISPSHAGYGSTGGHMEPRKHGGGHIWEEGAAVTWVCGCNPAAAQPPYHFHLTVVLSDLHTLLVDAAAGSVCKTPHFHRCTTYILASKRVNLPFQSVIIQNFTFCFTKILTP